MLGTDGGFTFQAGARPIEQRPKYRNDGNAPNAPCLITVDPRVCRGSTYVKHKQQQQVQTTKPRRKLPSPRTRELPTNYLAAPPPRENRIDLEVQTEPYLQEVLEAPVCVTRKTQTDAFLDRPPTPPYIPPKNGIDIDIQVEESDLFDFDFEVQPIVSTIVGKTIEQAFLEVHEEEELANIRRHKEAIEHQRNVELADVQRLEEAERRKFEEKQRRMEERERVEREQHELRNKIAARGYGEFFASDLLGDAISLLELRGYFYDEVEREIETQFIPWLGKAMEEASETRVLTEEIQKKLNEIVIQRESECRTENATEINAMDEEALQKKRTLLRQMLIEDLAGHKIRDALRDHRKKTQPAQEEEDQNEE